MRRKLSSDGNVWGAMPPAHHPAKHTRVPLASRNLISKTMRVHAPRWTLKRAVTTRVSPPAPEVHASRRQGFVDLWENGWSGGLIRASGFRFHLLTRFAACLFNALHSFVCLF